MISCDSPPDSGDFRRLSPALSLPLAKRDCTPPPSTRKLRDLYGDFTWAPMRVVQKKKRLLKIVAVPLELRFEEDEKQETVDCSPQPKSEVLLATGDSPHIVRSLELLAVSPSENLVLDVPLFSKTTHPVPGHLPNTPPSNVQFIRRQYGDLTNAPSTDRATTRRRFSGSPLIRPTRLFFDEEGPEAK